MATGWRGGALHLPANVAALDVDLLPPAGGASRQQHFGTRSGTLVWAGDRLVRLARLPWHLLSVGDYGSVGGGVGLELEDPGDGARRTIVPTDEMEPEDGGSALTVTSFDNVALVWTRKCLGLYDTVCTFQLHRIALPDGTDTVVAVSPDPPVSALSPDHGASPSARGAGSS